MNLRKKQNTLAFKVSVGFGLVGIILIGALLFTILEIHKVSQMNAQLLEGKAPVAQFSADINDGIEQIINLQYQWLITREEALLKTQETLWDTKIGNILRDFHRLPANMQTPEKSAALAQLETGLAAFRQLQQEYVTQAHNQNVQGATDIIQKQELPLRAAIKTQLKNIYQINNTQAQNTALQIQSIINQLLFKDWSLLILGFLLCSIMAVILTRSMTGPIYKLVNVAQNLAKGKINQEINIVGSVEFDELSQALNDMVNTLKNLAKVTERMSMGDYSQRVIVKSDEDILAITVNKMLDNFNQIVNQSNAIAKGDYSLEVSPRSAEDVLGIALLNMTRTLRSNKKHNDEENWVKDGIAGISATITGTSDVPTLCSKAASTITRYLDAAVGALYLYDPNNKTLKLMGSHAFMERSSTANQLTLGEGIIGQVGLEQKPILLRNVQRKDAVVRTGITEEAPFVIYAFPLVYEKELIGVMEVASTMPISSLQVRYIEQLAPLLSIEIQSAQQQTLTEELLKESKLLAEKLQIQQEELKATNEELEQQTQILRASEEELRLKDEEQRAINEKLAERTRELERQKSEIEEKTRTIQKARDELKIKAEELEEASQYKSEFLANMSHELRTPLNSLLILAKLLSDNEEGNLTADQVDCADIMLKSGQDLLTLINDILDLAKVEAGKIELVPANVKLKDFADSIGRDFTHVAEKRGITLATEIEDNLPEYIYTDDHRVNQVIRNLISNAIKFTEVGEVRFKIMRPKAGTQLNKSKLDPNKAIAFSVIDTGIGIAPDNQRIVFNSFQQADGTTSRKYGGTGLGLSISTQLATLLGGEIALESVEGKGSTFTLFLPEELQTTNIEKNLVKLPPQETGDKPKVHTARPSTPGLKTKTIPAPSVSDDRDNVKSDDNTLLIVEDDLQFTKILINICHKKGFKCLHAGDAETGLQLAHQYHPNGILLDIGLPGMDGLTMLDTLKSDSDTQFIPVHIISAIDESTSAIKKGAIGYLTKPVNQEQLETAIQKIESTYNKNLRDLLIIEQDKAMTDELSKLLSSKDVKITQAANGEKALELLASSHFDCIVLDISLPDMTGREFLERYHNAPHEDHPAVVIYTEKSLSESESEFLNNYSDSIIIKGENASMNRLIDETQSFLHRVATASPAQVVKTLSAEASSKTTEGSILKEKKILVVDDDMRNTFALSKILKSKGMDVVIAANGKTALETLEAQPDIALVLMDIMMPVMDGYEAIKHIRENEKLSKIPIIAVTAKVMKGDKEKCLAIGASGFLAKPIDTDELVATLKSWL